MRKVFAALLVLPAGAIAQAEVKMPAAAPPGHGGTGQERCCKLGRWSIYLPAARLR